MQVASALFCLRQRNTYQGNMLLPWSKTMAGLGDLGGLSSSFDHSAYQSQESGPHVAEIIESSRTKAQKMVDVALQVRKASQIICVLVLSLLISAVLITLFRVFLIS